MTQVLLQVMQYLKGELWWKKKNKYLRQILNEPNKYGDQGTKPKRMPSEGVDIVSFLLEKGADVDAQSLSGYTA